MTGVAMNQESHENVRTIFNTAGQGLDIHSG